MNANSYPDTQLLIDNQWVDASSGKQIDVVNPATGERIGAVAHAGTADLDRALSAASTGFQTWRHTPAAERAATMRRAAGILKERADATARLITLEQGKPLFEAKAEVQAAVAIIEWFADEGLRVQGRVLQPRQIGSQQLVLKEPIGPVAAFTPWNFPINQVVRKLSAALAAGCSFLCKAAEETPAAPAALLDAFVAAGMPPGVLGLVYGNPAEISHYLISSPVIRKVSFTGSTAVGKMLAALAGQHMKRVTMELGGHAPVIIAGDADVEQAAKTMAGAKFRNAGQVCISPTRFLVQDSLVPEFTRLFVHHAEALHLGDGLQEGTTLGPLANTRRITAMESIVSDARSAGADILTGGTTVGDKGNFYAPTVIGKITSQASLFNVEPFGPIAGIQPFRTLEDAIAEANRLPYGLAAYAYTSAYKNVELLSRALETGMLWINQASYAPAEFPFGGVKDSGYGSEGGQEALEPYLNTKAVSIKS
ncbi:NAD-dependent succinate-semialdehyde dehydrogenase [Castellaniella sp. FW104-16D08]|uniref:NAD-dependent succinate-semialdehyde dehydrogenase n=1 Tax=unclassified Castellaniella TaxID=2617606 RepID=UPI00331453DA